MRYNKGSMNRNRCRCGDRAVTELRRVPEDTLPGAAQAGTSASVLVFTHWCPACFRRRFGEALAAPDVREWISMERARSLVERETWR